jgi:hypothetical protein
VKELQRDPEYSTIKPIELTEAIQSDYFSVSPLTQDTSLADNVKVKPIEDSSLLTDDTHRIKRCHHYNSVLLTVGCSETH